MKPRVGLSNLDARIIVTFPLIITFLPPTLVCVCFGFFFNFGQISPVKFYSVLVTHAMDSSKMLDHSSMFHKGLNVAPLTSQRYILRRLTPSWDQTGKGSSLNTFELIF